VGAQWQVDGNSFPYLVDPILPWELFHPRQFRVEVYAGLPDLPTDVNVVNYYIFPWSPEREAFNLTTPLPLSSTSKGQLTIRDLRDIYPSECFLWEGDLSVGNWFVEIPHTVTASASSVEFHFTSPKQSIIEFSVINDEGLRIDHNLTTGNTDLEFPGTITEKSANPQIISIPLAGGRTFTVRAELKILYSEAETHHAVIKAFEIPVRPAILAVGSSLIEEIVSIGSEAEITITFGEAGGQEPLEGVEVNLGDIEHNGYVLPLLTESPFDLGMVLSGTGTSVSFFLDVPVAAEAGLYTGQLQVATLNAGLITVPVTLDVSHAPDLPTPPSGITFGYTGESYEYTTSTADPDYEEIYYKFCWDDGTRSEWLGPYLSGDYCTASHVWSKGRKYHVRVVAKDAGGHLSDWSEPLKVNVMGKYHENTGKVKNMKMLE